MPDDPDNRSLWSLWTLLQRLRDMLDRDQSLSGPSEWVDTAPYTRPKDGEDE